jgi:hypothetical protein
MPPRFRGMSIAGIGVRGGVAGGGGGHGEAVDGGDEDDDGSVGDAVAGSLFGKDPISSALRTSMTCIGALPAVVGRVGSAVGSTTVEYQPTLRPAVEMSLQGSRGDRRRLQARARRHRFGI